MFECLEDPRELMHRAMLTGDSQEDIMNPACPENRHQQVHQKTRTQEHRAAIGNRCRFVPQSQHQGADAADHQRRSYPAERVCNAVPRQPARFLSPLG